MAEPWPPRFTVDNERVLRLFTGDRFYSSSDAALREALLNAIDACGRRREAMPTLAPAISLTFDEDAKTITIADNGDGMSQEDVSQFFTKIGASAAQLAEKIAGGSYKAVGEFGIGVVSYFLVSDRFQVHTVNEGSAGIGLEFAASMLDGATPAEAVSCQRTEVGTTLTLFVKSPEVFEHLLARYPHWVRDVAGVTATKQPGDLPIEQG